MRFSDDIPTLRQRKVHSGFTFVEMLVTLAIMAVLVTVAVPMTQVVAQRQKEQNLRSALIQIREAIDAYKRASDQGRIPSKIGESGYPKVLDDLWLGVADQRSPSQQKMYFLRSLPVDPFNPDGAVKAADSWGLRSYASPPDDPSDGADVFDVYSRSEKTGLNGVAYNNW